MGVRISLPVQMKTEIKQFSLFIKIRKMNKIATIFKESYTELVEKVTWPTWEQLQQSTMIVLVSTLLITAVIWVMDFSAGGLIKFLYKFF